MKRFVVKVVVLLVASTFVLFVIGSITMGYFASRARSAAHMAGAPAIPTSVTPAPTPTHEQYQRALDRTWGRLQEMMGFKAHGNFDIAATGNNFGVDFNGAQQPIIADLRSENGTLYVKAPIGPWYDAGADAREYAVHVIAKVWAEEWLAAGLPRSAPIRVIVMDKQRDVIVTDPPQ